MKDFKVGDFIYVKNDTEWFVGQIDNIGRYSISWRFVYGDICPLSSSSHALTEHIMVNGEYATDDQINGLSDEVKRYCNMEWDGSLWRITVDTLEN